MNPGPPENSSTALWASTQALSESAALVRFFCPDEGALSVRAPGLLKPASKLAPLLQPADELRISTVRGRGGLPTLTGATLERGHPHWRESLQRLALVWFMLECGLLSSSSPPVNSATFQLTVNLLRSEPSDAQLAGALSVYCIKLLALHGLLPDLKVCQLDGHYLGDDEPAFVLPSGEGLCGCAAYNAQYARSAAGLLRLDPLRRQRWLSLQHGALLLYVRRGADAVDAAALLHIAAQRLADVAEQRVASAEFLSRQWKLPDYRALCRDLG
jgi:recombinational DNA repair protein (RecF pathway)